MAENLVFYVDIDDTLIRSFGSKRIPISRMVEHVRYLAAQGCKIYLWSRAGDEYVRQTAIELELLDIVTACLSKPNIVIDDENLFEKISYFHPNEAASKTISDY